VRATLLSWNVAGRVKRLPEQFERVAALRPDVVCLQEVSRTTAALWRHGLTEAGWEHVVIAPAAAVSGRRALRTLTAARFSLEVREVPGVPWPERVLVTEVEGVEVTNFHSPISPSPNLAKVRAHEAVHAYLISRTGPRLVCGDFNTPRREHADGRVWTFARDRYGKLREERGERWDQAELSLIKGLEPFGFRDAFRSLHGLEARALSWEWQRSGGGYRLDHLVVSSEIDVSTVDYLHDLRADGLSDHSGLLATIAW